MKFGTERTQKYGGSKYKMTYVRPYILVVRSNSANSERAGLAENKMK